MFPALSTLQTVALTHCIGLRKAVVLLHEFGSLCAVDTALAHLLFEASAQPATLFFQVLPDPLLWGTRLLVS